MDRAEQSYDFNSLGSDSQERVVGGCGKVAIGCGIVALLLVIVAAVGVFWIANNTRAFGASVVSYALKQGIEELKLPPDQEKRVLASIDKVVQDFKDGKITDEQAGHIFEAMLRGPLLPAGLVLFAERVYLDKSGFDDQEKADAADVLRRFAHGVVKEQVPEETVDAVLNNISSRGSDGERRFRDSVTDEELRQFIADARQAADDAEVPLDIPAINFADEFQNAIDRGLSGEPFEDEAEESAVEGKPDTPEKPSLQAKKEEQPAEAAESPGESQ